MKTPKKILVVLVAVGVALAVLFGPRTYVCYRDLKIRRQVSAQLARGVPAVEPQEDGRGDYHFKRVEILHCRTSTDGNQYDVRFRLWYDGLVMDSGILLRRDEWGCYRGDWTHRSNTVTIAIK